MFINISVSIIVYTVCPRSLEPFHIVTNSIKVVKTFWEDSIMVLMYDLILYLQLSFHFVKIIKIL